MELTIDELARETGMTVRNIRSHASRGLLPPPEVRARTGYYGPEHVARLRLILELQAAGHSLAGIKHLLVAHRRLDRRGRPRLRAHAARAVRVRDPGGRRRGRAAPSASARSATSCGTRRSSSALIVPLGEGRFEVPSPGAAARGRRCCSELGVPLERALSLLERISRSTDSIAEQFVKLFLERFWTGPDADLAEVQRRARPLRPLATEAVVALFHQRMTRRTEKAFSRALERK